MCPRLHATAPASPPTAISDLRFYLAAIRRQDRRAVGASTGDRRHRAADRAAVYFRINEDGQISVASDRNLLRATRSSTRRRCGASRRDAAPARCRRDSPTTTWESTLGSNTSSSASARHSRGSFWRPPFSGRSRRGSQTDVRIGDPRHQDTVKSPLYLARFRARGRRAAAWPMRGARIVRRRLRPLGTSSPWPTSIPAPGEADARSRA